MMEEGKFELEAMDFMTGAMSSDKAREFEKFLGKNPEFKNRYNDLVETWSMVNRLETPKPSVKMDEVFFEMLSNEVDKKKSSSIGGNFLEGLFSILKPQLTFGILFLAIGLGVGYYLAPSNDSVPTQTLISGNETAKVRQKLVLTLLDQPSANQRLQGVGEANKFENADDVVIKALLQTLNQDPNVNVRLAAVESLTNYVDNPLVRQGLVKSIPNQESPILQITLANLMVALQEKASIEPFKQLLKQKQLDTTVKKRIEKSIESII